MRCSSARRTFLFENRIPGDHVDACASCRAWIADQRRLTVALGELGRDIPWDVDVTARVAVGVAAMDAPRRDLASPRQLGWAAGAGLAAAAALAVVAWIQAPDLVRLVAGTRTLLSAIGEAVFGLTAPVVTILTAAVRPLGRLIVAAGTVARSAAQLQWLAVTTISLCSAMMVATVLLVVSRDVRRHPLPREDRNR